MLYATHRLYTSKDNFLKLYVVNVEEGRVVSFFPFDGERERMIWVDNILLIRHELVDGNLYACSVEVSSEGEFSIIRLLD